MRLFYQSRKLLQLLLVPHFSQRQGFPGTDQMDPGVSVPKKRLYKMSPVSKINSLQNDSWKNKG